MAGDDQRAAARIGVVLAGGRGTRLGGDKAAAPVGGTTLLAHAVATVRAAGLTPAVCARSTTGLPPAGAAVWREPPADDAHPLAGLAHALEQAGEVIVALPVDLPLLPAAVLSALAVRPEPLVVVATGGRPAALVVRAGPEHAAALRDAAARSAPALRTLLDLGALAVDLAELVPGIDAGRALLNVNTPGDLSDATAALGG